ncbi:hypothetical protein JOF53_006196 [Crossiella equi]|uniref:Hedgehog/Intein (Hint) domain-containing protein n=1 Tax=Crossiella equi TaxID=130796 RepID=A0ABS5AM85_9PSEU|nr:hypothetical protein [Crossiella equi]MBP2477324.1 hypothetical protein [Crossiella equi]
MLTAEEITAGLAPLTGQVLGWAGRVADMVELGFGDEVELPSNMGGTRRLPRHVLHLRCPCRVLAGEEILLGSHDVFRPEVFQARAAELNALLARRRPEVLAVRGGPGGALELDLAEGLLVQVLPVRSGAHEAWRYFRPGDLDSHVVVPDER